MNYSSLLDVPTQINDLDSPRTGDPTGLSRADLAYALHALGATYVLTEDPDTLGPCARCSATMVRYGLTCTSSLCVACNVLRWVQS